MCTIMCYCGISGGTGKVMDGLKTTVSRGPDDQRIVKVPDGILGFQRLSIMGLTPNGEIYGFRKLRDKLIDMGYIFRSDSDCEILLPLYREYGTDMFSLLDAEFACVIYDCVERQFIAARDPIGIRPLYYGKSDDGTMVFASEPKNLVKICFPSRTLLQGRKVPLLLRYHRGQRSNT